MPDSAIMVCGEIIAETGDKDPLALHSAFLKGAQEAAGTESQERLSKTLRLLGGVLSMYFRPELDEPFVLLAVHPRLELELVDTLN
ncbi:MAG: hypothetical protein ACHQ7N_18620 [Candidatus Methylomirabilales bacterium]